MKLPRGPPLFLTGLSFVDGQNTFVCPSVGSPAVPITDAVPGGSATTVRVPVISDPDGLCTLVRHNATAGGTQRAPVARSYVRPSDSSAPWEISAGPFANADRSGLVVDCALGSTCDIALPGLGSGEEYVLESFSRPALSPDALAARFLERATFGPTREAVDALVSSGDSSGDAWVASQMTADVSSLREFYRRRVNPKYEFPYVLGAVGSGPCELYSRWRTYAISSRDMLEDRNVNVFKYLTITQETGIAGFVWKVDGQFRTVTDAHPADNDGNLLVLGTQYKIHNKKARAAYSNCVGCDLYVSAPGEDYVTISNPAVSIAADVESELSLDVVHLPDFKSHDLPSIEDSSSYPLFSAWIKPHENAMLNATLSPEESAACADLAAGNGRLPVEWDGEADGAPGVTQPGAFGSVFARSIDGDTGAEVVFLYDRHLTLYENTVENPLADGGGQLVIETASPASGEQVKCHNVERNFYNEDSCTLSTHVSACEPGSKPKEVLILNDSNLEGIRGDTNRLLYAVKGLTLSADDNSGFDAPCAVTSLNQWSRWIKDPADSVCDNVAALGAGTLKIYREFVDSQNIGDLNTGIVDADRDHSLCDVQDQAKTYLGKVAASDGSCWHHVHHAERDVFDLTEADSALYTIDGNTFTVNGGMDSFNNNFDQIFPVVGRFGDHVDLNDGSPPSPLDDAGVQEAYGTLEYNPQGLPVLMCGSPEEVASDPFHGDNGFDVIVPENSGWQSLSHWELAGQKHTIWSHLALEGDDQLRLKTAWSLSQIVSVGTRNLKNTWDFLDTEGYLAFYDMFVKNAFGNYRDLMREFSFSSIMANWLSFIDNRSLQYNIDKDGVEKFPDENFAREIMQLFSVGLVQLEMDGSVKYQANGNPLDTYSIEDIQSYARAWTGFVERPERGGALANKEGFNDSTLDPLRIRVDRRDHFPKSDLAGGFIGDKVARCADLPKGHALRRGATYHLLGGNGYPKLHDDPDWYYKNPDFAHLELDAATSPLYAKLCEVNGVGECTLPSRVVLDSNLVYEGAAVDGDEYKVDTIRTVKMMVGSITIWYEYVRQPCVEHSFYRDAKRLTMDQIKGNLEQKPSMCGNPLLESATPMCSDGSWKDGLIFCNYQGERTTYATAEALCAAEGMEQSYPWQIKQWKAGPCQYGISNKYFRSWANAPCGLQVKVELGSGDVGIVHNPGPDRSNATSVESFVDVDTLNLFAVPWEGGVHPTESDCIAMPSCRIHGVEYCICDTEETESVVYTDAGEVTLGMDQLMDELLIGAVDPAAFDMDIYTGLGDCGIASGVSVYTKAGGDCVSLTSEAIFAFEWNSKSIFLKNAKSVVSIPDLAKNFAFRNPVQFISLSDPEDRDAYHETEAVLDSLFYHPSHPPFLAQRMLQRFGSSNPSPGLVGRVATAYRTGNAATFGSGTYGDMGAMVAAILLDDESRSPALDADQSHGHLREPLVKVLSFFRSMGLHYESPFRVPTLMSMQEKIGQGSFDTPSVFSFFLPEFQAPGGIQSAGLVAPEAEVLRGDNILFLLDAYYGTVKFGIVDCQKMYSFEGWRSWYPFSCPNMEGDTSLSPARLSYLPQSAVSVDSVLDELDVLLTSGRLQDKNRALIKSIVEPMVATDVSKAVRVAQQLILSTPEYHATNLPRKQDIPRVITGYTDRPKAPYKAVVIFNMRGGVDSWNMLVAKGSCATSDAYQEYVEARGTTHAIPKEQLIDISATGSGQDCQEFGVNENFPVLAELYNQSEAVFFANTGVLAKPMTKNDNWKGETGFRPFAHNTMQDTFKSGDIYGKNPGTGVMGRILDVLKEKGLQTSANNVDSGLKMLQGDQIYNNAVYTVSTKSPTTLNKYPTLDNLIDVVKELNGVGESGNSHLSEYWSSRVSAALFEHEQMHEIANAGYEVTDYPVTEVKFSSSFKAIAGYMNSREYRKVNRDVFVLSQGGYDMHNADELAENFHDANWALTDFVQELKAQGLWESTVIMSGSDFGRSMNTNSNGGTDHAWGGNYWMVGGSVNGGKIKGQYPSPLGPGSDYWLKRGRWLPTTPWEAVFNAVAQWLGVHDDANLDWALPNRESFGTCSLFTDKDLFTDGRCECIQDNGAEYSLCEEETYSPTIAPSESPTYSPTRNPTTPPTAAPSNSPSTSPTSSPTGNPTAELPDDGWLVDNIFSPESTITNFGCLWPGKLERTFDGTTDKYYCDRTGLTDEAAGIIISPENGQLSIVKKIRVYAQSNCKSCDIVSYIMEGRINATSPWVETHRGDFSWKTAGWNDASMARNPQGLQINSTYESGETNLNFVEVNFHGHSEPYLEYKLTFETRTEAYNGLSWAAIEIPGMVLPPEPSVSPTLSPSTSPTSSPTKGPTVSPTKSPSTSPTTSPTENPTADLPDNGWLVTNILEGSTATSFGCVWPGKPWRLLDGSTDKYSCDRRNMTGSTGIIFSPEHGQRTIPKSIRMYSGNSNKNSDPISYTLEGRLSDVDAWAVIASGDLPWTNDDWSDLLRNDQGQQINSTYENGDPNLYFTQVNYHGHSDEYLEYKLTIDQTRSPTADYVYLAELEITGMLMPPDPSVSPTLSPSRSPTVSPTHSPTVSPTTSPSVSPTLNPTDNPTAQLPDDGWFVTNIFQGSYVTNFGCTNKGSPGKIGDGTTDRYNCGRTDIHHLPTGIIVTPEHGKRSIVKALRLYTSDNCKNCDPTGFVLEGRADDTSPWVHIREGDFEGVIGGLDRNPQGLNISSTYESGDTSLTFVELNFYTNSDVFFEYRVSFPGTKSPTSNNLRFAELEAAGMLIPPEPSASPTPAPSTSPTKEPTLSPSTSPTQAPSTSPTKEPTQSPTSSPTDNPTAELPADGTLVTNVLAGMTFTNFGCVNTGAPWKSSDGTTNKYWCDRTGMHNYTTGVIASSSTGQLSIPKEFRIYAANGCKNCFPDSYSLEGRVDVTSAWVEIASGDFPWKFLSNSQIGTNDQGLTIGSTYSSPDEDLSYSSTLYHSHSVPYLDYKMTFETRDPLKNALQYGEIEIPGMELPLP